MALPQTEEPDPFAGFGAAELFGFIHHKLGEEGLRELLTMMAKDNTTAEFLQDAAAELEQAGLAKPAAIVAEIAAKSPSELDLNPYETGSLNWQSWRQSRIMRRRIETGELEADLRRRHRQNTRKT